MSNVPNATMVPTVHLNGTSGSVLSNQAFMVTHACNGLLMALSDAAPNGRDYYTQGPDALKKAQTEHANRVERVKAIFAEYTHISEMIQEQIDAKNARRF